MVIQYLPDQTKALDEMYRVLKPGGGLAFSYEGEYYLKPRFEMMKTVAERMGFKKAADTWDWILSNHKPVDVFYRLIEKAAFTDVKIKEIYYLNHNADFERMTKMGLMKIYGYFREGMSDGEVEEYRKELIIEAKKSELLNTSSKHLCFAYAVKPITLPLP
jgi:trans-aconitate methyltransferase